VNTKSQSLFYFAALVYAGSAFAQEVTVDYGSGLDTGSSVISQFTNEAKSGFTGTGAQQGMMAFGYFSDGFNVSSEAAGLDDSNFSTFLGNFNVLAESSMESSFSGYLQASKTFAEAGVGKDSYLITLSGVTSWTNASSASEIGLFRDTTTFDTIPAGGDPVPTEYAAQPLTYDTVVLGTQYLGEDASAIFGAGWTANVYASQALPAAVPEPSTYAMMLGAAAFGFVFYKRRIKAKKGTSQDAAQQ
jgi:hypothetical protein